MWPTRGGAPGLEHTVQCNPHLGNTPSQITRVSGVRGIGRLLGIDELEMLLVMMVKSSSHAKIQIIESMSNMTSFHGKSGWMAPNPSSIAD